MIAASILILCSARCTVVGDAGVGSLFRPAARHAARIAQPSRPEKESRPLFAVPESDFDEILFLDRLHQTFLLLNQIAIPAYLDHFNGEPDKRAIVLYYAERLAAATSGEPPISAGPRSNSTDVDGSANRSASRDAQMRAALADLRNAGTDIAEYNLGLLGAQPHGELSRAVESRETSTARCLLYDPELLWAHRRLRELKTGRAAPAMPANVAQSLDQQHASIRSLREQPGDRDLSLRKFLDKHRQSVWKLAWWYRCRGMELDPGSGAARACFLRAWAIGDALFPASERGRLDRFDPIFLAELADVYARLERFDLMLRYIYCDEGLPARFELARPVAELARVAESVRLVRADETTAAEVGQELPETVSQILFDLPVVAQPDPRYTRASDYSESRGGPDIGWLLIIAGGCLVGTAIGWGIMRVARTARRRVTPDL